MGIWRIIYLLMFRWTPKPLFRLRALVLRIFGAKIEGTVFVASSASIKMPWNLEMLDRSCIGAGVQVYNLAAIKIGRRSTVAQESYLCTGTHDFADPKLPLVTGEIEIGDDCFVGARAFLCPGVRVGSGAIVGAASVVTRDVPAWMVSAGNPSKPIGPRTLHGEHKRGTK